MTPPKEFNHSLKLSFNIACALNNIGVTMLLRGELGPAAHSFHQAMTIVRMILSSNVSSSSPSCLETRGPSEAYILHKAQASFQAESALLSKMSSQSQQSSDEFRFLQIQVVESNDFASLQKASHSSPLSFPAIIIRDPSTISQYDGSMNKESGVMIYNHGLTCFLITCFQDDDEDTSEGQDQQIYTKTDLNEAAEQTLQLAYTTFSRMPLLESENATEQVEASFFATIALSILAKVLRAHNKHEQAQQVDLVLDDIYSNVQCAHPFFSAHKEQGLQIAPAA